MSLIAFNADNTKHQQALDYFLYSAGHPVCKLDKIIEDIDVMFRFIAIEEFELDPWISDDPNGSFIAILDPSPQNLSLVVCLEYFDEQERHREVFLKASGDVLINNDTDVIVWNLDTQSLDLSNSEEFEVAEKENSKKTE